MSDRKAWRGIGLAAAMLLATAASAGAQPVFKTNIIADPAMLSPITYSEIIAGRIMDKVYEGFSANTAEGKIVPALATEWKANDDATVWRFTLRKGVKMHSGREFTAKDVKYTFEQLLTPGNKAGLNADYLSLVVGAKDMKDGKAMELAGFTADDPYTVEMRFTQPDVLFPIYPFYLMDAGAVAEHGPDWVTKVSAGTGPFKFNSWRRGVEVKIDAHKDYWGGAPSIGGVQFLIVPSGDTALSMYEAGELHFALLADNLARRLVNDPKYKDQLVQSPRAQINYLGLNQTLYAPFKDVRVREAVSLALDRPAMMKGLWGGTALPLNGQITPGVAGYNPGLSELKYDPERAKKLLAEAGYPGGKGLPPIEIQSTEPFKDELAYYANQFKRVLGWEVSVKIAERATHIRQMNAGEVAFFPWGWTAGYPDAMYYLSQVWYSKSPYNRSRWSNAEFDKVIDKARTTAGAEERYKLYHEAEKILMADWGTAPLPILSNIALRKPNVKNVTMTPFGYSDFNKITID
jgi:peptide/nickel transport system substrate-binding protein